MYAQHLQIHFLSDSLDKGEKNRLDPLPPPLVVVGDVVVMEEKEGIGKLSPTPTCPAAPPVVSCMDEAEARTDDEANGECDPNSVVPPLLLDDPERVPPPVPMVVKSFCNACNNSNLDRLSRACKITLVQDDDDVLPLCFNEKSCKNWERVES